MNISLLRLLAAAGLCALLAAQAAALPSYSDPVGDDDGDGNLTYPREAIYEAGDLDLRSLQVHDDNGQLRFEITFRNPVRDPASLKGVGLGNEDLSLFARRGFYAFNLDIYLDLDRQPGSGHVNTLPGRGATIDAAHAWERAIVLTPRPELMRRQLRNAVAEATGSTEETAEAAVDAAVHFVRDVRVRGRSVSFTVPKAFVDTGAMTRASMVAFVTAARLSIPADSGLTTWSWGNPAGRPAGGLSLGVAPPQAGQPADAMGWRGARAPATAIVDLLAPDAAAQALQLGSGRLSGLGGATPASTPAAAPAPADAPAALFGRALALLTGPASASVPIAPAVPTASSPAVTAAPPAPAPAAAPAASATAAPAAAAQPAVPAAAAASAAPPVAPAAQRSTPAPRRDPAFLEEQEQRLRTLRRLRESGLISEAEYQRKRQEVIDAL